MNSVGHLVYNPDVSLKRVAFPHKLGYASWNCTTMIQAAKRLTKVNHIKVNRFGLQFGTWVRHERRFDAETCGLG